MEDAFEQLKKDKKNNVDSLIKWMKESNVIDGNKVTEEKAREYFSAASNEQDVQLDTFKEVLAKAAADKGTTADELQKALAGKAQAIMNALSGAASALADALK